MNNKDLWMKRSPLGSIVTFSVGVRSLLFLNQDTCAAGLLYGGLQVTVTFLPLFTVRFVGCCTKLQSISVNTKCKSLVSLDICSYWILIGFCWFLQHGICWSRNLNGFNKAIHLLELNSSEFTIPAGRRKAGCDLIVSFWFDASQWYEPSCSLLTFLEKTNTKNILNVILTFRDSFWFCLLFFSS